MDMVTIRGQKNLRQFNRLHAIGVAVLAMSFGTTGNVARGGVTMTVDAKGGVGQLVTIQARYDLLDASTTSYLAGTLTASINGGPSFDAYCVDLYHVVYVGGGGSSFEVNPQPIAQLSAPAGHGAGVGFLYQNYAPLVANAIDAAALQVALWKLEYDNGGLLTTGHFTVLDSSDLTSNQHLVFAKATANLSAYHGSETGKATWLEATSHPFDGRYSLYQNLVGPGYLSFDPLTPSAITPDIVSTPEPATVTTAILGTAVIAGLSWRRRHSVRSHKASRRQAKA